MAETYDITYEGATIGTASKEKQGLYYKFCCRCSLPDDGFYRIQVICGKHQEDLGICVPMEGFFGMDKKLPVKRLGEGELRFKLVSKDSKIQESAFEAESEPEQDLPGETEIQDDTAMPFESEEVPEQPAGVGNVFVSVSENEPFEYLDRLENAVLETRPNENGILLQQ